MFLRIAHNLQTIFPQLDSKYDEKYHNYESIQLQLFLMIY